MRALKKGVILLYSGRNILSLSEKMDAIARKWTEISDILKMASENGSIDSLKKAASSVYKVADMEEEFYHLVLSI